MKKTNKIIVIIVLFLIVLFGVGQFFASSNLNSISSNASSTANSAVPPTQVVYYKPPALTSSTPVVAGSCWTNSIAAPYRTDAWRCALGNGIDDPCFEVGGSTSTVLCGMDPTASGRDGSFAIRLTKPLPPAEILPTSTSSGLAPWLVELQGGTLCSPFTGTLPPVMDGGATANYDCAPGAIGKDAVIFGNLDTDASVWTADVGQLSTASSTFPPIITSSSSVPVEEVWE